MNHRRSNAVILALLVLAAVNPRLPASLNAWVPWAARGPVSAAIVEETGDRTALTQAQVAALLDRRIDDWAASHGSTWLVVDKDNKAPESEAFIAAAAGKTLPVLVVCRKDGGKVLAVEPIESGDQVLATLKRHGGE